MARKLAGSNVLEGPVGSGRPATERSRWMSEPQSREEEREQIATLLRQVIVDTKFRNAFDADPREAIVSSGISLSPQTIDKIVEGAERVPAVTAHMEGTGEISKIFFFAKVIDE
jgi:hypothetical protein